MRIDIIGGGPGGLYAAILLKARDSSHDICVYERNGPDDTFGYGVVFSDKTMSYLAETDGPTHRLIEQNFQRWANVVIGHKDQIIEVGGNHFAGIERLRLLQLLHRRCRELGVEVCFHCEVLDLPVRDGVDLVIGADGVNSLLRSRYEAQLRPHVEVRPNRYIWLGTTRLFNGLTLLFREGQHGTYAAHAYRYDSKRSTFIVEVEASTFEAAGLGAMSLEEILHQLREVFDEDLAGHELLVNNSKWLQFQHITCERWHHERVVLLGDAVHTAHFSIGSGTKLALESAIALVASLGDRAADVPAGLARYEETRRPTVDRLQTAAHVSMEWFERMGEYTHLAPYPFAYEVMTRSGKLDLENLRRRDPAFVEAYEAAVGGGG